MAATKEELKEEIKAAIKNANRNMYEWVHKTKFRKDVGSLTYDEVHSVTKNWIVRRLRKILTFTEITSITRRGNLSVTMSTDGYIASVKLIYDDNWTKAAHIAKMIQDILYYLDYESLRFNPADYANAYKSQYNYSEIEPSSDDVIIDLSSIEKIKF